MSIEEKAKAYDEALERARKYMAKGYDVLMPEIFPQLRESEDERIRKSLIDNFKHYSCTSDGTPSYKVLAWLEKQKYDRMKPIYDARESFESALEKAWKSYNDSGARTVDGCEDDYVECAHAKGFREGFLYGLEKQKEQRESRPTLDNPDIGGEWSKDLKDEIHSWLGHLDGKYTPYSIEDIKLTAHHFAEWQKQKEQKEQQQFISCDSIGAAILSALASGIDTDDILKARGFTYEDVEKYLISVEQKEQKPSIFPPGLGEVHWNPIPSAKKELVEKPAERSEDTLDEFTENIRSLITRKLTYHDPNGSGISSTVFIDDETAKDIANGVLFYVSKEAVKNPKREIPEWSEEDEERIQSILFSIGYCKEEYPNKKDYSKDINWLKSLCPQPKAKLTLLDENIIKAAVAFVEQNDHFNYWGGIDKHTVIKALRSIKPSWKPSEEQMKALADATKRDVFPVGYRECLETLYEQLKKL